MPLDFLVILTYGLYPLISALLLSFFKAFLMLIQGIVKTLLLLDRRRLSVRNRLLNARELSSELFDLSIEFVGYARCVLLHQSNLLTQVFGDRVLCIGYIILKLLAECGDAFVELRDRLFHITHMLPEPLQRRSSRRGPGSNITRELRERRRVTVFEWPGDVVRDLLGYLIY
ncbi:hypothetical protein A7J15_07205 [Microbacterium sediminis]|uniref:Uncharacterized protein n=1 Tax=Microbacterium sediminis TaxID=904291 RepID=A0A1B9NA35_9MICO|nr:hypothetical protein A7J15_07205 [Microbacterium sediminis]